MTVTLILVSEPTVRHGNNPDGTLYVAYKGTTWLALLFLLKPLFNILLVVVLNDWVIVWVPELVEVNVTGVPAQILIEVATLFAKAVTVGEGFTLIACVTEFEHPLPSITVYVMLVLPLALPKLLLNRKN